MEIDLRKNEIPYYQRSACSRTAFEAGSETVVPDYLPDICEIVSTSGITLLRSRVWADGVLTISGSVLTQTLYLAETDSLPKKLELEIPFDCAQRIDTSDESLFSVSVHLAYAEARALNPRKLGLRCSLCAEISAFESASLCVVCEAEPERMSDVCLKKDVVCADLVSGVFEKSFIVTDAYPLPGTGSEACELLGKTVSLYVDDTRFVGTKMILKGIVQTELLWQSEGEGVSASSYRSEFSQILEIGELEQPSAEPVLTLTGAYFETPYAEGGSVSAELHILAQVVCSRRIEIAYISDAYSNHYPLIAHFGERKQLCAAEQETRTDSMRGVIETSFAVTDIVQLTASPGIPSAGDNEFSCPINVRILIRDETGALHGFIRSFAAKWPLSAERSAADQPVRVYCRELSAVPAAAGVEVRLTAVAESLNLREVPITPLESAELDESIRIDPEAFPSVTVLPEKSADLWTLAKRYHSTASLIEEANRDLASSVLLIPRAR